MQVVGGTLAASVASVADGRLGLAEHQVVTAEFHVIDAEQDDGLAVVALVEPLREFDSLG